MTIIQAKSHARINFANVAITGGSIKNTPIVAPAAETIVGTVSAGGARTVVFSSATDCAKCKVGSTLVADGDTRIIVALPGSPNVTVDSNTTWAGATAITSLTDPISQHKDNAGNVDMYVNALGGIGLVGGFGIQKGIVFGDGDSGIYEISDDQISVMFGNVAKWRWTPDDFYWTGNIGPYLRGVPPGATTPNYTFQAELDTGMGRAAADQLSLIAGGKEGIRVVEFGSKPYIIIGGTEIAHLTTCTFPTANKNQISKTAVGTNLAVGDLVLVTAGTNATLAAYRATVIDSADLITVDRDIHAHGSDITDGAVSTIKDGILLAPTDGTNGQRMMNYSHQDKPLQIGGDIPAATGHSLGSEDVLIGGIVEHDKPVHFDDIITALPDAITAVSGAGTAASIATIVTKVTTNGDSDEDNVTLAAGVNGQIKMFSIVAVGNVADSVKITPASLIGGTQITFAANPLGLGCIMVYDSGVAGWIIVGNNGGVIS